MLGTQSPIWRKGLKLAGIRMHPDEPINRFVIYESKVRSSLRPKVTTRRYLQNISSHLLLGEKAIEANLIRKIVVNKSRWNKNFVAFKKKNPSDPIFSGRMLMTLRWGLNSTNHQHSVISYWNVVPIFFTERLKQFVEWSEMSENFMN